MRKARNIQIAILVLACIALAMASTCLCGCLGLSTKVSAAATVNGTVIDEAAVTSYVEGFRDEDESRETDSGWAKYLIEKGYTAESFRSYVLNSVFIPNTMIALEAGKRDIVVTDDELDSLIESERQYYEQLYGVDTWDSVLSSFGYDQTSWREKETTRLLKEQLCEKVIGEVALSDSQIQSHAASIISKYSGKHSYFIAFNNKENAEEALASLGGEGTLISRSKFKKLGNAYKARSDARFTAAKGAQTPQYTQENGMVNAGWSSLSSYVQKNNAIYTNAINALSEDAVSGVIDMENGTWVLVFCDEAYVSEDGDIYKLDQIPNEIYKQLSLDVQEMEREEQFNTWLEEKTKAATVAINSMPDGLPYDVNISLE